MMNKNQGFSMMEVVVVMAIVGILTSMAVSSFGNMIERNQLKNAIQMVQDDLQFARLQAIKLAKNVSVNRTKSSTDNSVWCYGLTARAACNCTLTADSTTENYCEIKSVSSAQFPSVRLFAGAGNGTSTYTSTDSFDFKKGTITADGLTFYTQSYAARVVFSPVGRVRICTPPTELNTIAATNRPVGTIGLPTVPDC